MIWTSTSDAQTGKWKKYERRQEHIADYSRYKTATLQKMREAAWKNYATETQKPLGNWGDGMRLSKLPQGKAWEKAREQYHAICAELEKREAEARNDYSCIETAELKKMEATAYSEYYKLAVRPRTNPSKEHLKPLEKATAKYEAICAELWKRGQCDS